jgi:flavin-dependent dehydrogenase
VDRVCLIDGGGPPGGAAVGETIPPDARLLLDRLGLLSAFLLEGHAPCLGSCSAWGSDVLGYNDFLLNPHGCGWHLDRARFDAFLREQAGAAGAARLEDARLTGVEDEGEEGYRLLLSGGRAVSARFVVDATGRTSAFARHVGARPVRVDRLTFVYGFFDTAAARSRSRLTLLEAACDGWWYAAALPGDRLAVSFATDAGRVRPGGLSGEPGWLAAALATRHLAERLEGCRFLPGSLVARVAPSFLLDKLAGPNWLAIGDAAACFDPLAAQGLYKAMEDALGAAALIAAAQAGGGELDGSHAAAMRSRFDDYLANRGYFYGLEQRWPASDFWRRRRARSTLASAA